MMWGFLIPKDAYTDLDASLLRFQQVVSNALGSLGLGGAVSLDDDATNVTVTIQNSDGATLRTIELGAQAEGAVAWDWDGTTDTGDPAGDGPFTVKVTASNAEGMVHAVPLVWAPVSTVSMGADGQPVLTLPGIGNVPLSAVWQVG